MIRLLTVTRSAQLRKNIARVLAASHHIKATHTASFEEATKHLSARTTDVMLVDQDLDERTGWDLIEQLCVLSPRTRSLMMRDGSSHAGGAQNISIENTSAVSLPFSRSQLISSIEKAYETKVSIYHSREFSLLELLQLLHQMERSDVLTFHGEYPGVVRMEKGEVVHAQTNDVTGEYALQMLLQAPPCWIRTAPREGEALHTIKRPFHDLLFRVLPVDYDETSEETEGVEFFFSFDDDDDALKIDPLLELGDFAEDSFANEDWSMPLEESSWNDFDIEVNAFEQEPDERDTNVPTPWERVKTVARELSFHELPKLNVALDEHDGPALVDPNAEPVKKEAPPTSGPWEDDALATAPSLSFRAKAQTGVQPQLPPPVVATPTDLPPLDAAPLSTRKKWLRNVITKIPTCVFGACVDLSSNRLLAYRSDGYDLSNQTETFSAFAFNMFKASADASADVASTRPPKEIVAFSNDLVYILNRGT